MNSSPSGEFFTYGYFSWGAFDSGSVTTCLTDLRLMQFMDDSLPLV